MGSARAARRIQPGGLVGPAGAIGSPQQGDRPSAASSAPVGRTSSAAVRRDRLRFGQEGSGGEGGSGRPSGTPRALQRPPAPTLPLSPGPRAVSSAPSLGSPRDGAPRPRRVRRPDRTVPSPNPKAPRRQGGDRPTKRALEVRGDVGHPPDPS